MLLLYLKVPFPCIQIRENFEKFWDDISPFIKFGVLKDEKFYEKVENILIYKTVENNYLTIDEYLEGKESKDIYYATDSIQQAQYINMLKENGIETLLLEHSIDSAFISYMEMKKNELHFKRVDSDISDALKETLTEEDQEAVTKEKETLTEVFKKVLGKEELDIELESLKEDNIPAMVVLSEENRRMQEMMERYAMSGMEGMNIPSQETLILNRKNPLIQYMIKHDKEETQLMTLIPQQVYDLAMLSHKQLSPEQMAGFIKRSNELLGKMIS